MKSKDLGMRILRLWMGVINGREYNLNKAMSKMVFVMLSETKHLRFNHIRLDSSVASLLQNDTKAILGMASSVNYCGDE